MTTNEANKIIADYMGAVYREYSGLYRYEWEHGLYGYGLDEFLYSHSLDALAPVWERLNFDPTFIRVVPSLQWHCELMKITLLGPDSGEQVGYGLAASIQEAAAIATAKAIQAL